MIQPSGGSQYTLVIANPDHAKYSLPEGEEPLHFQVPVARQAMPRSGSDVCYWGEDRLYYALDQVFSGTIIPPGWCYLLSKDSESGASKTPVSLAGFSIQAKTETSAWKETSITDGIVKASGPEPSVISTRSALGDFAIATASESRNHCGFDPYPLNQDNLAKILSHKSCNGKVEIPVDVVDGCLSFRGDDQVESVISGLDCVVLSKHGVEANTEPCHTSLTVTLTGLKAKLAGDSVSSDLSSGSSVADVPKS